jgi:hypothetical protein
MINLLLFTYGASFFAGAFLCNCLPHLLCGLQGAAFPTPFAKPPGVGDSSPLVNFLWGAFNLLVGVGLLYAQPVTSWLSGDFAALAAGFVALGVLLSRYFGKVRQGRPAK